MSKQINLNTYYYKKSDIDTFLANKANLVHVHGNISNDGKVGTSANKPLITGTNGVIQASSFGTTANTFCQGNDSRLSDARTPISHTHTKAEISDFPTSMTPTSHAHGNITNAGAIGSTANLPVITTTSGKLTTGSFGTGANTFCQGNDPRLSDARTPTSHTHSYLPLSGGTMTGPIQYPQLRSSATVDNIPYAGLFNWNTNILTTLKERKSLLGSVTDGSQWWSVISVRHRNGTTDGNAWGMHIRTPLTTATAEADANLYWQRDLNGTTTNERVLIDNENMVRHKVVNNVLSRATNNQSTAGYFKILTIGISGNYIDSPIQFTINRRLISTTNVQFYVQYYQKDTSSSSNPRYYKLNKCYYDGQALGIYVKQTVDNAGAGTFDIYTDAEAWSDLSVTPIITNNARNTPYNVTITPKDDFVTSLPSGYIQATRNPNYVDGSDSRLTNARTPTSHTHGNITNEGAIGSTANLPVITTTSGKLTTGSFGTSANTFCQGNDARLSDTRTPRFVHIDASSSVAKDLNNYKTGGFYYTQNNVNDVPYVANRPDSRNFAFFLLVETWGTSSNYVKQTLTYYDTGTTYTRTCNNNNWSAWTALIREGDLRLSNARTPTAHASTATTYGASSASNYGHSMASSTSPKAPGTANVGSETAKFARGDHVHPLQSSTTTTLSLTNTTAMSGTVKCTESNGWGVVYFEELKSTTTTTGYTQFATLPHTSKARIYANCNLDAIGTNAILFRVNNNYLEGRVFTANQRMYGSIVYPIA